MLAARALRTAMAGLYFVMVARSLGLTGYGAFAGACAMVSILSPFATLGTGNLLIQAVARERQQFPERWGICLVVTLLSGALLTGVAVSIAHLALPRAVPLSLIFVIAVAELLCARLLDVSAMAFQALEQLRMTASFTLWLSVCRLLAAACLLLRFPHASALQWSGLYLVSTLLPASIALRLVCGRIGMPRFRLFLHRGEIVQGIYFSISLAAQSIYNDIDKAMLARIAGLGAAGIYSAAYRLIDAAFSPVNAVLAASYSRFFQYGGESLDRASRFARRLLPRAVLYSVICCATIWIGAPFLSSILGRQFADSVPALRLLSPLLLLRSLHCFAADSLTGAGYQGTRTSIQVAVALFNIALNLAILPRFSWRGAVWTSLASDGAMVALLWLAVWSLCARERRLAPKTLFPQEAVSEL